MRVVALMARQFFCASNLFSLQVVLRRGWRCHREKPNLEHKSLEELNGYVFRDWVRILNNTLHSLRDSSTARSTTRCEEAGSARPLL